MHDGDVMLALHDDTDCQLVSGTALRRKAAGGSEKEPEGMARFRRALGLVHGLVEIGVLISLVSLIKADPATARGRGR